MQKTQTSFNPLDLAEVDNRCRWQLRPPPEFPSPWACEWGFDNYGLWQAFAIKGIKQVMRFIPDGTFLMGSHEDEPERYGDETQHLVTLTNGFWLGETTVSQALWEAVKDADEERLVTKSKGEGTYPKVNISWDDCQEFCEQANELLPGLELTLPTEAQWEYACRAGTQTPFSTGEQITKEQANYGSNHNQTMVINSFEQNPWGLYQMHGNVWEWCRDAPRDYTQEAKIDPEGDITDRSVRAVRGGGWIYDAHDCRSAFRSRLSHGYRGRDAGLRVAQVT